MQSEYPDNTSVISKFVEKIRTLSKRILPVLIVLSIVFAIAGLIVATSGSRDPYFDEVIIGILALLGIVVVYSIIVQPDKFSYFIERFLACIAFLATFLLLSFSILLDDIKFINLASMLFISDEIQIYITVCSSGMMGGIMRYFVFENIASKEELDLWRMIYAAMIGLFVALVIFLLLRSGIISRSEINTYNVTGVAGVSIIAGFFSDRVIDNLSKIYNKVVDTPEN